jgi:competence protein ComEA
VVLGLLAAVVAVVLLVRAQPRSTSLALPSQTASARTATTAAGAGTAARSASPTAVLAIDVTGKVHHPGVYKLSGGSRVIDAVRAAGGALHGISLDSLNLAARLTDGQQVVVGGPAGAPPPAAGATSGASVASVVDLNSATVDQLQTLPGIGPVLAQHIVDYRTQHGPFASVDALQQVSGIGPSKFAQLKDHVSA